MTPLGLPFGTVTRLTATVLDPWPPPDALVTGVEITLERVSLDGVEVRTARAATARVTIKAANGTAARDLDMLLASPWPRLAVIEHRADARVVIAVNEFTAQLHWPDAMEIGFPDRVLQDMRRRMQQWDAGVDEVASRLAEELILPPFDVGGVTRCLLSAGADIADATRPFRIHGAALTADVRRGEDGRLTVTRLRGRTDPSDAIVLVEVDIGFAPGDAVQPLSSVARGQLATLAVGTEQYLKLWTQYAAIEKRRLDAEARQIGVFRYESWAHAPDGSIRFTLANAEADGLATLREAISGEGISLQATKERPAFSNNPAAAAQTETPKTPRRKGQREKRRATIVAGKVTDDDIDADGRWITLRPDGDVAIDAPVRQGFLSVAQTGSRTAAQRREDAHEAIRRGTCPMRQLGLLLENHPLPFPAAAGDVQPLSPAVIATLGGKPTDLQKQAVDIAVNTPDIAVIQGPPGTGKTQVIAAIVKRLEEIADPEADPVGLFLITSYQHVAVENVAERVRPFGLPALKIGKSRRERAERESTTWQWVNANIPLIEREIERVDGNRKVVLLRELQERLYRYINGHHLLGETARILEDTAAKASSLVPVSACAGLRKLAVQLLDEERELTVGRSPARERAYRAAYALRYIKAAYEDDGPATATRAALALDAAGVTLEEAEATLLRDAAARTQRVDTAFLIALGRLRENLLAALAPDRRPISVRKAPRTDVIEALSAMVAEARATLASENAGVALLLDDYLGELERNDWRVRDALAQYTAARAETCQGSANAARSTGAGTRPRGFETVIIDEAARANPLDLLIPMAQARRRIILVGDHKQLPHALEPEIEEELTQESGEDVSEALRVSLFERLFEAMQDRFAAGEAQRTVTLDRQFRMHSVLGEFVSNTFYGGAVGSDPARDADLAHGLPLFIKDGRERVAVWVNVPAFEGPVRGSNRRHAGGETATKSKTRPAEVRPVRAIVKEIHDRRPDYGIGVISFYKEQVLLLRRQFGPDATHVHVGTVDELQGREYPVVLLSMTRSNEFAIAPPPADTDPDERARAYAKAARRRFGFLTLQNRMCVALSRQKRLLIVVGDRRMLTYPEAPIAIGPLVAFDQLCGTQDGLRVEWSKDALQLR